MATMGPHRPKDGWQLRWIQQGAALCLAAPLAFLVLGLAALLLGAGVAQVRENLSGLGRTAALAGLAALSLLPAVLVSNLFLQADHRGRRSFNEILGIVRPMAGPGFAVIGLLLFVSLHVMPPSPASAAVASAISAMEPLERVLADGLRIYLFGAMSVAIFNPLWTGSAAAMGLGLQEAWFLHRRMLATQLRLTLILFGVGIYASNIILAVHPLASLLLVLLREAWFYVAAREVLGGIDENGHPESSLVPHAA